MGSSTGGNARNGKINVHASTGLMADRSLITPVIFWLKYPPQ